MADSPPVDVDPTFELRLREVRQAAASQAQRMSGGRGTWYRPAGLADPLDPAAFSPPFDRDALSAAGTVALDAGGTTGELVLVHLQLATLSALERAVRSRYHTGPRLAAFAQARQLGHGDPAGVWGQLLEEARRLAADARDDAP